MERIERRLGRSIANDREALASYQDMSPAFFRDLISPATVGGTIDAINYLLYGLGDAAVFQMPLPTLITS